ncbi:P-loop containing nucleoside triphosphate hydrolase protein [Cyathus striatus]|nr:P-loop containing nucleoside triphosphate hydrolase protein [Cyathus striatus]
MSTSSYSESDVVILLLGQTGVGKSTFINYAAGCAPGSEVAEVGGGVTSCTKGVKDIPVPFPNKNSGRTRVILIDTPGFNDTWDGDVLVFEKIRNWLVEFHAQNPSLKFSGILYLYDISQARNVSQGDSMITPKNFEYPPLVTNLHFVATHWNRAKAPSALERELELQQTHWKNMLERGAQVSRFENSKESANAIISRVLDRSSHQFSSVLGEFDAIHRKVSVPTSNTRYRSTIGGFFARLFRTPGGINSRSK